MVEITIWLAFFAGVISFLSPCIFPLVPAYLAQLTGTSVSNNQIQADRSLILSRSIGFIIGFTIIFVMLGASSTFVGRIFLENQLLIQQIGGIIIVVFGLQMAGIISISMLLSEKRLKKETPKKSTSFANSVFFGLFFGAGWSPCIGLVLSSILLLAMDSETMFKAMFMLFIYSMGLGVPFILVALLWSRSLHKLRKFNRIIPKIQKASGYIMIILGILLFTGKFAAIAAYLTRFQLFNL
ncbi:cytochrome c biogenesis protein CcdA [Alkalihalophilus pseudofirmus]|uniref:cytochrome c biogenesis CcdA family protein n=1 Tax=Alkalihalobacterium alkalinitrilicum TaxID=427920 RepID=UPI00094CBBD3|nr:cytochrome c biogenesis protein CcdA [Alkalihalobacterium alkalinitrilicum]OLO36451.1 cytochrome c biogenesis protein CcdA [Alkalihalophilus pseudofirmus]